VLERSSVEIMNRLADLWIDCPAGGAAIEYRANDVVCASNYVVVRSRPRNDDQSITDWYLILPQSTQ